MGISPHFSVGLLRDGVNHALGLVDLDLVLLGDTAADEGESRALSLADRDAAGFRDGVTRELVALVLVEKLGDDLVTGGDFLLLLAVRALALLVARVELLDQRLAGGVHLIGQVGVKNGLKILASGHGVFLSALHALGC